MNILSGITALIVIPPAVRTLAAMYAISTHGGLATVYRVAIPILWCITIPWAIIGIKIRNVRIDRRQAS